MSSRKTKLMLKTMVTYLLTKKKQASKLSSQMKPYHLEQRLRLRKAKLARFVTRLIRMSELKLIVKRIKMLTITHIRLTALSGKRMDWLSIACLLKVSSMGLQSKTRLTSP